MARRRALERAREWIASRNFALTGIERAIGSYCDPEESFGVLRIDLHLEVDVQDDDVQLFREAVLAVDSLSSVEKLSPSKLVIESGKLRSSSDAWRWVRTLVEVPLASLGKLARIKSVGVQNGAS